jgi:membrane protein YqaA with SNARE-associated domain
VSPPLVPGVRRATAAVVDVLPASTAGRAAELPTAPHHAAPAVVDAVIATVATAAASAVLTPLAAALPGLAAVAAGGPPVDAAVASIAATVATAPAALPAVAASIPGVGDLGLSGLVETARGPFGLVLVFVYSVLIAFALPGVSEIVLAAPLELGLTYLERMTLIILVSAVGKTIGSLAAFHLGQEAKESGPVTRWIRNSRYDVIGWSERRLVRVARNYGYLGLAAFLSVPGFPDTISIYAFSVIETDYPRFAVATFVGSVNRLVLTLLGAEAVLAAI